MRTSRVWSIVLLACVVALVLEMPASPAEEDRAATDRAAVTTSVIQVCVSKKSGAMRYLAADKTRCRSGERKVVLEATPADLLSKLSTVDGAGSGLDTDLFAGLPLTSFQQRGTTTACAVGEVVTAIGADGNVTCAPDRDTTYSAGAGLALNGMTLDVTTAPDSAKLGGQPAAAYKAVCPQVSPVWGAVVWTGTVCMMSQPDAFASTWDQAMGWCRDFYGPAGRLPTYAELIAAAKLGLVTLTLNEHTADSAGDDQEIFINSTNPANADGVRPRATQGPNRCVFAPLQPGLGSPAPNATATSAGARNQVASRR